MRPSQLLPVRYLSKAVMNLSFCFIIVILIIFSPESAAQVGKRSVCGRVTPTTSTGVGKTEVGLYFADQTLLPGAVTERDGTFCIENYVSDLGKRTPARLFVTLFCRVDDVALVKIPFWPRLRREASFSGKRIIIDSGSVTNVGNIPVQLTYGHISLRILDHERLPLLTEPEDWFPIWIRVRNQNGATVHESGLSPVEIERSVDLKESRINLALPEGVWKLEVALGGVPPETGAKRRSVRWIRVPGKVKIESCSSPLDVAVSVSQTTKSD